MNICKDCTFFIDFNQFQSTLTMPDGINFRCIKEARELPGGWPPAIFEPEIESCVHFVKFNVDRPRWEWGTKNEINIAKHEISFSDAVHACETDPKTIRIQANTWEKIKELNFDELGIDKNTGNLDPVRDIYLFKAKDKVWKMITTFRGEKGIMVQRVISVHRANKREIKLYLHGL